MNRDPWTDLYHLAERLARVLDEIQPGGGTARAWLATLHDDHRADTIRSCLEIAQRIGDLIVAQIPPEEKAAGPEGPAARQGG